MDNREFIWTDFYKELADKLLEYKYDRRKLLNELMEVYVEIGRKFPRTEKDGVPIDIDPFTVFAFFNNGMTDANRIKIATGLANKFNVKSEVPTNFNGIPTLMSLNILFFWFEDDRQENDIDNLWELFERVLKYADSPNEETKSEFTKWFDIVKEQSGVKWNLTMGLYWVRPESYLSLDSRNRWYINEKSSLPEELVSYICEFSKKHMVPSGIDYLGICDKVSNEIKSGNYSYNNFYEFSLTAWNDSNDENERIKKEKEKKIIELAIAEKGEADEYEVSDNRSFYSMEKFLDDAYMSEDEYNKIVRIIKNKKNVILQGAPGVGKTYYSKRLAYSILGSKDEKRVKLIQFHQSYSYEDFIMGYRPSKDGFTLEKGVFHKFCVEALLDKENDYFFIIDEINRGNLSKIFGELFMLIENDKRGETMKLLYSDDEFTVPENVHIIGMMNTADRSLAMLDYALRRRFAFYDISPKFDSEGFKLYVDELNNDKFSKLIECVKRINSEISNDSSLGSGFCIGHSYFCNLEEVNDDLLSDIVEFEIIPLLNEYWFDESEKVRTYSLMLRDSIK